MRLPVIALLCLARLAHADDKPSGDVLVWNDARLFVEPAESATSVSLASFKGPRSDHPGAVMAMHVRAVKGDFVEVEAAESDCTWNRFNSGELDKVKLYVRSADLAPVVIRPVTVRGTDGTSMTLDIGSPVVPVMGDRYIIPLGREQLAFDLPSASVGRSYPPTHGTRNYGDLSRRLAAGTVMTVAGTSLTTASTWNPSAGTEPPKATGSTVLFTVQRKCVTLTAVVPTLAISMVKIGKMDPSDLADMLTGDSGDQPAYDFLPAGTQVSLGTQVFGVVHYEAEVVKAGKLACFDYRPSVQWGSELPAVKLSEEKLKLCAPAAKAKHAKAIIRPQEPESDMNRRRPGADLGTQIKDAEKRR